MNTPDLSIVIPALHEADRIGESLDALAGYVDSGDFGTVEVIVVAADSTDGTSQVARSRQDMFSSLSVLDLSAQNGKGADVNHGMRHASGQYRIFMDADMATPLHHLYTFRTHMQSDAPVIIGVRDIHQTHTGLRKIISSLGNIPVRWLLGLDIRDTQCGFKAFRRDVAECIFSRQRINSWGFDIELLAIARKHRFDVATVELPDWQDVAGSTFQKVAITGALQTFRDLLRVRWNMWRGVYD